ncbi:hypothetical protein D3Z58_15680 [Clostridiaceae bacterium]|nr:hypothetical protein [Clostridiaceae bacterium]
MHVSFCGIFGCYLVNVAHYASLIRAKSPPNCGAHLRESNFQFLLFRPVFFPGFLPAFFLVYLCVPYFSPSLLPIIFCFIGSWICFKYAANIGGLGAKYRILGVKYFL